jgi:hypothetical protein
MSSSSRSVKPVIVDVKTKRDGGDVSGSADANRRGNRGGDATITIPTVTHNHLPTKRGRVQQSHTELVFANENEYKSYFICGQHKTKNVSPCVDKTSLGEYGLVYEEWQEQNSSRPKKWFYCRRQRGVRRKGVPTGMIPKREKRQLNSKKAYIGCGCPAKYRKETRSDGSIRILFFGSHNHCVQEDYAANFLNPVRHVRSIREFIDSKLFAGVKRMGSLKNDVIQDTLGDRDSLKVFEDFRRFQMGVYLKPSHITNRRDQLGLNLDKLAHK